MKKINLQKFVLTAVLAALACAATMIIQIKTPTGGYVNLGDCIVMLSAFMLGPVFGAAAGGIGSGLADFFSGYTAYIPGTAIIKALMAVVAALIYRACGKKVWGAVLSALAAEVIMIFGYLGYEWIFLGMGYGAVGGLVGNITQGICGLILSIIIVMVFKSNKVLNSYLHGGKF